MNSSVQCSFYANSSSDDVRDKTLNFVLPSQYAAHVPTPPQSPAAGQAAPVVSAGAAHPAAVSAGAARTPAAGQAAPVVSAGAARLAVDRGKLTKCLGGQSAE